MARIYSERLIHGHSVAANDLMRFTVPLGQRAIARQVTVNNAGPAAAVLFIAVNGIYVYRVDLQASPAATTFAVRWTVHATEDLVALCSSPNMRVQLDGFLFDDTAEQIAQLPATGYDLPSDPEAPL